MGQPNTSLDAAKCCLGAVEAKIPLVSRETSPGKSLMGEPYAWSVSGRHVNSVSRSYVVDDKG